MSDPKYFPITVWLQNPSNARAYRQAGVNLYVGLWDGPTEEQLETLSEADMRVICSQNETGLKHLLDDGILAWMHDDEPDNAQANPAGGYGPPVDPERVNDLLRALKSKDPSRPVYLNLGQGVAWHDWIGRGPDTGTTHKYPLYAEAADILSFDIYPVNEKDRAVHGKLWYVARGVANLRKWTNYAKPVWCWIETTKISAESAAKPTPEQVRSEVWMALIHGATGLGYFCHSWTPEFDDAAMLHDSGMMKAVASVNSAIWGLAPVLNSPTIDGCVSAVADRPDVNVDIMTKRLNGGTYVFAVSMGEKPTACEFVLRDDAAAGNGDGSAEVLDENRLLPIMDRKFVDAFEPYAVHIYRISG